MLPNGSFGDRAAAKARGDSWMVGAFVPGGGAMMGPSCGMAAPLPPRLYGLPLKIGDFSGASGILGPVPVRLVALVRALLPEGPLGVEDEPPIGRRASFRCAKR